jgi:hypothetical protein
VPCHPSQERDCYHEVIPVGFDEIMPCDGCWVNVMLTKWPKEILINIKPYKSQDRDINISFCKGRLLSQG